MKKLVTIGILLLELSLLAGCSGLQSFSSTGPAQDTAVSRQSSVSALNQETAAAQGNLTHPTSYTVTDLGTLGGAFSTNDDVDNSGAAAGTSTLAGDAVIRGFLWSRGSLINIGALPDGPNNYAQNVNERMQIVGAADGAATKADASAICFTASSLDSHAYLWQSGIMTDLGTLGGKSSRASWINNHGQISGASQINAVDPNGFFCGGP